MEHSGPIAFFPSPASSIEAGSGSAKANRADASRGPAPDFNAMLDSMVGEGAVRFSRHAQTRLQSRGIELTPSDLQQLQKATDTAREKGSRESLILMKNLGLIVNVKNRTVLTAIDSSKMKDNIITNIDSTVIVPASE